jgi:teichuronic acid biosynthesis glycosyltransferase TuaC
MKILVFTSLYPNNISPNNGVFIKERMTHFAKLDGCEVKVIAPVPYFPALKLNWRWQFSQVAPSEVRDGIEVYHPRRFMIPKLGMSLYGLMMFLSVLGTVAKVRKNFDFDLIDAHFVYPDGFAAVLLGHCFRKPVVVSARGSDINRYSTFPIVRRLLRYTLNRADSVIAVSKALKEAIMRLGVPGRKISVISNGVDIEKFHTISKSEARKKLGLPIDRKVILSVGHLTANKGFDLLIRATAILLKRCPERNIYVVIVGEGFFRKELEKLISAFDLDQYVTLTGTVSHDQLGFWYSAADLFCLASDAEGWPNVILESLACGTPVVATAAGGIPEIIRSETIGLLTERDDREIAETICVALNKPWRSNDLLEFARQHNWKRTALGVRHVFEAVVKGEPDDRPVKNGCDQNGESTADSVHPGC